MEWSGIFLKTAWSALQENIQKEIDYRHISALRRYQISKSIKAGKNCRDISGSRSSGKHAREKNHQNEDAAMGIRTPVAGVKGPHDWPDYTIAARCSI
jgi:hypothetical protein